MMPKVYIHPVNGRNTICQPPSRTLYTCVLTPTDRQLHLCIITDHQRTAHTLAFESND